MSTTEFLAFLGRLSYKPGYRIVAVGEPSLGGVQTTMEMVHPNRDNPTEEVRIGWVRYWTRRELEGLSTNTIQSAVVDWIYQWEQHEADEWIRLDGKRLHDPHLIPQLATGRSNTAWNEDGDYRP